MKHLFILFIATLFVQNVNAQDVVYVDEEGRVLEQDEIDIKRENTPRDKKHADAKFKEAAPIKMSANQITIRAIGGNSITTSSNLEVGKNYYLFEVTQAKDTSLIGKPVVCQIIERRKSNLSGIEGRLILRPLYIETGSRHVTLVQNDIYRRGLNRTNVKIWTLIPWFIAGSRAEILPDEEIILTLDK